MAKPSNNKSASDVAAAKRIVAELEQKRAAHVEAGAALDERRAAVSYQTHVQHDPESRRELDDINAAVATHASELASYDHAIAEARRVLADARRLVALAEEIERAGRLKQAAAELREIGPFADKALETLVTATLALRDGARSLRACGGGAPTDAQVLMLWRTVAAALARTPFAREFPVTAPNERKSFQQWLDVWCDSAVREADAILAAADGVRRQATRAA